MKAHPAASCMGTEVSEAGQGDRVPGCSWADPHPHRQSLPNSSPHCLRCGIELCFYNFSSPSADSMCRVIFKKTESGRELLRLTATPLVK